MIPVSPIKSKTHFRQVSLKMLCGHPTMRPPQDRFYVRNKPVRSREQMAHHLGLGQTFLDKPPVLLLWEEYHKGAS